VPASIGFGQISPGDLAQAHADLEGISNCTLCHDLGKKVSNAKCLDCHKEIKSLVDRDHGYHASRDVKNKDCFECHSDHHGRKFDMVRFDEDNFDHDLTEYTLEGQHDVIDCRKCHVPDNIKDPAIRKLSDTFLGLDHKCLTCHDDYHQETLSNDCSKCHDIEAFRPAPKFDHDDTDYKLTGEHVEVDCKECHEITTKNGSEFQMFADIGFNDCVECHDDPHNNQLDGKCAQCHTETSFSTFTGKRKFNHNRHTDFDLNGAHKSEDCFNCHNNTSDPLRVFQDRNGVSENQCASCHEDVHYNKFGNDCAKCHLEDSFLSLKSMDFFDHNLTDYHLEGKHIGVDCKQCHETRFTDPIDFSSCNNCHVDYHEGEFTENGTSPDCIKCHSLEKGFDYSLFTLEQHQESAFPLDGGHLATPCFACHVSEDRWTFREIGTECIDCHQDIHEGFIGEQYYPDNDCKSCHITDSWAEVGFDHTRTQWPLEGKHAEVDCRQCHFETASDETLINQVFSTLENDCIQCHDNVHEDQFAINGVTDCKRCHDASDWMPNNFDHNTTAFPLEGRHAEIECIDCHKPIVQGGKTIIEYKIEKFECIDCHQ
jgi:nitrate/TMAO reductase-like tetraheme cytochrome c subunit